MPFSDYSESDEVKYTGTKHNVMNPDITKSKSKLTE